MDVWNTLNVWADQRLDSVAVTLIEAPSDLPGLIGQMAVLKSSGAEPQGPLTENPFWPGDWETALKTAADGLTRGGALIGCGPRKYYLSVLAYERSALVLGGGHVGGALCRLLRFLEFQVTIMDDRPDFLNYHEEGVTPVEASFNRLTEMFAHQGFDAVVIVTRGHAQDSSCLRQVLTWLRLPGYVGMIGSRHRTRETLKMLEEEGFAPEVTGQVHTPVGLKIGAQTPAEIAVSIAAEIIMVLNKNVLEVIS